MRHCHRIVRFVSNPACTCFGVDFHNKIQVVMACRPFTELQHFWKLISRVDVQNRKWYASKKRFAREPDENVRSEERRVGKECRYVRAREGVHGKKESG